MARPANAARAAVGSPSIAINVPAQPAPSPDAERATPRMAPTARACELEVSTFVEPDGDVFLVKASIHNLTDHPLELVYKERPCIEDALEFRGLPEGYDFRRCPHSECMAGTFSEILEPREAGVIFDEMIDPRQSACNRALPPGSYELGLDIPNSLYNPKSVEVCTAAVAKFLVPSAKP